MVLTECQKNSLWFKKTSDTYVVVTRRDKFHSVALPGIVRHLSGHTTGLLLSGAFLARSESTLVSECLTLVWQKSKGARGLVVRHGNRA